jgi:2,4-dienoyl-CoA reductase-like NADH-dependent reductase (Old Yellow Enzyme family)
MAEGLADKGHLPGERISRVYSEWAKGGWGALLTGREMTYRMSLPFLSMLHLTT